MELEPAMKKKIKVEDEVSMDIAVCFPIEIYEMIFENLAAKDLLEASLVNQKWHKIIGNTKKCMEKINLKLRRRMTQEDHQILRDSTRKYQNVKINAGVASFHEASFKENVRIDIIEKIFMEQPTNTNSSIIYPKLKKLEINDNSQNVATIVRQILVGSSQLEIFSFDGRGLEKVFDANFSDNVDFKLKHLRITNIFGNFPTLPFMIDFLKKQINSLESLEIERLQWEWVEVALRMPKLKVFKCKKFDLSLDGIELAQSNSIEAIHLFDIRNRVEIFRIVEKSPNLKHLEINVINNELFTVLSATAPNLESLECRRVELSVPIVLSGNPFPKLKEFTAQSFVHDPDHLEQIQNAALKTCSKCNFLSLYSELLRNPFSGSRH